MPSDYARIARENTKRFGTEVGQWAPTLLSGLYSDKTHFVYELLQNAEDADASTVHFQLFRERLEFSHDGRLFDEKDVRGVCGLVEGMKPQDLTTIGHFGLGFKAVFAYTATPEVHSGGEHFLIEHYVRPRPAPARRVPRGQTLIVLPFNREDVDATIAFRDIGRRLTQLGGRTLLFLRSVAQISWEIDQGGSGRYVRRERSLRYGRQRSTTSEVAGNRTVERWLIFSHPVERDGKPTGRHVEVAFRLGLMDKIRALNIEPLHASPLFAFFATERETRLRFLIQGPYQTTPARDNLPWDGDIGKWNRYLIDQTAHLLVESLRRLRDVGGLTVAALGALPLDRRTFPADSPFAPLFDAVQCALSTEALIPTEGGHFQSASCVKLARGLGLRELLPPDLLGAVFGSNVPLEWVASEVTSDRTPDVWGYLVHELKVEEVTPESFTRHLSLEFLQSREDRWLVQLYRFLEQQRSLWQGSLGIARSKPFLRLEDDRHVTPFDPSGQPNAYLPPPEPEGTEFPIVKRSIAADEDARRFLEHLGLKQPDITAEALDIIVPRYLGVSIDVAVDEHERHMRKIEQALRLAPGDRRKILLDKLRDTYFILVTSRDEEKRYYARPRQAYIASDDLREYFAGNTSISFVAEEELPFREWLVAYCGVAEEIRVLSKSTGHGNVILANEYGHHSRGLDGFDPDCEVEGLGHALEHLTPSLACLIWNRILIPNKHRLRGVVENSRYQHFGGAERKTVLSTLGRQLREAPWLPDRHGGFHRPSERTLSDLPEDFCRDETAAVALGMKPDTVSATAKALGVSVDRLMEYVELEHDAEFQDLKRNYLEHKARARHGPSDLLMSRGGMTNLAKSNSDTRVSPEPLPDEEKRRRNVAEEIAVTRDRDSSDHPARWVRTQEGQGDRGFVVESFKAEYGGRCQVCGFTFPKRNGEPYFEVVHVRVPKVAFHVADRLGGCLCLCANCCAEFLHGAFDDQGFAQRVLDFDMATLKDNEPYGHIPAVLCGNSVTFQFSQRHLIDMQEVLRALQEVL